MDFLSAVSDPARLELLLKLAEGEQTVSQLAGTSNLSTVSVRLRVLNEAGLLERRTSGKFVLYQLRPGVHDWLEGTLAVAGRLRELAASERQQGTEGG